MRITEQFFCEEEVDEYLEFVRKEAYSRLEDCNTTHLQISSIMLFLPFEKFERLLRLPNFREGWNYCQSLMYDSTPKRDLLALGVNKEEKHFSWKGIVFVETFDEDFVDKIFVVKTKTLIETGEL